MAFLLLACTDKAKHAADDQQNAAHDHDDVCNAAPSERKQTQTTQIVSVATVGAVNAGLLAGAFFFLRRKRLF